MGIVRGSKIQTPVVVVSSRGCWRCRCHGVVPGILIGWHLALALAFGIGIGIGTLGLALVLLPLALAEGESPTNSDAWHTEPAEARFVFNDNQVTLLVFRFLLLFSVSKLYFFGAVAWGCPSTLGPADCMAVDSLQTIVHVEFQQNLNSFLFVSPVSPDVT